MGQALPRGARPLGYAALAAVYALDVPAPGTLFATGDVQSVRSERRWSIMTPRYRTADTLVSHLAFALRHEAVDLGLLAALFRRPEAGRAITAWNHRQPTGRLDLRDVGPRQERHSLVPDTPAGVLEAGADTDRGA